MTARYAVIRHDLGWHVVRAIGISEAADRIYHPYGDALLRGAFLTADIHDAYVCAAALNEADDRTFLNVVDSLGAHVARVETADGIDLLLTNRVHQRFGDDSLVAGDPEAAAFAASAHTTRAARDRAIVARLLGKEAA